MKQLRIHIPLLTLVALLTSCASDEAEQTATLASPEPVMLKAVIEPGDGTTRAISGNTWSGGEFVAVKTAGTGGSTKKYKVNSASTGDLLGTDLANTHHWWSTDETKTIAAWAYGEGGSDAYSSSYKAVTVPTTQDANTVKNYDMIWGTASVSYANRSSAELKFYHQMAKVTINVTRTGEANSTSYPVTGVTIGSLKPTGTFVEPAASATDKNHGTWTLSGTAGNITPYKTTTASGYQYSYVALVLPQTVSGGVPINITLTSLGTKTYKAAATLSSGVHYTCNVTVNKESISVSAKIYDWSGKTIGTGSGSAPFT